MPFSSHQSADASDQHVCRRAKQTDFPKELYDVRMYALRGPGNAE